MIFKTESQGHFLRKQESRYVILLTFPEKLESQPKNTLLNRCLGLLIWSQMRTLPVEFQILTLS